LDQTRARTETLGDSNEGSQTRSASDRIGFILREHFESRSTSNRATSSSTIVLDGPVFEDLDVVRRRAVIAESGAQAVVSVRVVVGGMQSDGWSDRDQEVEVMVKLGDGDGDTLAWAARCRANAASYGGSTTKAVEEAARCAVRGGTGN
ncbi:MAG: hypothetical protein JNL83_24405, partial [Myxococcales bacterium]|nr:hypothetical protein [Myxococcales bacterium]